MSKNDKKKKKSSIGGVIFVLIILILAVLLLMLWKGGFGLGAGQGGDGLGTGDAVVAEGSEGPAEETAAETELTEQSEETSASSEAGSGAVIIEVTDNIITADGIECTDGAALKDYLLSVNSEETVYILRDNKAVKAAYDDAKAILDELGYEYAEE